MSAIAVNRDVRVATGENGGIVVVSAWCSKCADHVMPSRDGVCLFCRSVVVDEDTLPAKEMLAQIAERARSGREPQADDAGGDLMVATGRGLRVMVEAPKLPPRDEWITRSFLAALLRASVRTAASTPAEIDAAVEAARAEWDERHAENVERWRASRDGLREKIRAFEEVTGLSLASWGDDGAAGAERAARVGAAVRLVLDGDANLERFERRFVVLAEQAERLAGEIRDAMPKGDV